MLAANFDHVEVARILVSKGADRTIEFNGKAALGFAKSKEVKELLS